MTYTERAADARRLLDAATPRPWRVNFVGDVVDVGGKPIAVPMEDADAGLIAAAPGLLEWALGLLNGIAGWADENKRPSTGHSAGYRAAVSDVRHILNGGES